MPKKAEISAYYKIITIIGASVTLIAGIVVIATFIIEMRAKKIEIDAQVIGSEELTTPAPEAELKAQYTWAGDDVSNLWKIRINFINARDKTIIGKGSQKNILNDGLNFVFPEKTRILRVQTENANFKNTIIWTMNQFQIRFSQWRAQEYITACFYLSSEEPLAEDPFPIVLNRDILDGNVVVQDLRESKPSEKLFLIDKLPKFLSLTGKIIGGILAGLIAYLFAMLTYAVWKAMIIFTKWKNWKKLYLSAFIKYLDNIKPQLSIKKKKEYALNPKKLPEKFWANFDGPPAPKKITEPFFIKSIAKCIVLTIALIVIIFGFASLILTLIPA